jgi:predicted DsbA family dithiol-disulfide isomerase
VRLAHKFAFESEQVRADMVEITEFPYLANKYNVMGVPLTVVNDSVFIEGARPEAGFLDEVLSAAEPRQISG